MHFHATSQVSSQINCIYLSFQSGGLKDGDYIVGINDGDAKWSPHDEVVNLIKASGHSLKLRVVTPMQGRSQANKKEKVRVQVKCG